MNLTESLISSYSNGFPFSKEAGLRFIKESLEEIIFCGAALSSELVRVLGYKNPNESDKLYALRKLKELN